MWIALAIHGEHGRTNRLCEYFLTTDYPPERAARYGQADLY